ncbi:MAG: metal transporter, partial [Actinomycetota bacterium]
LAFIPLLVIGALAFVALRFGSGAFFPGEFPPVEELTFSKVTLAPNEITAVIINGGPSPVTVAQVLVDDAFWAHTITPSRTLRRLESATIKIPYPWVEAEPIEIKLLSSSGIPFTHAIAVATTTPPVDAKFLTTFGLLGIYIGLIPVLLGMAFLPFLRTLSTRWLYFFMSFTAGVLIFLGVETLTKAIQATATLPSALGGIGVVTMGVIGSFTLILAASRWMKRRTGSDARLVVATTVAAGIGLHNLGEGLAVGAAYRLGEIALGAFLVVGFAIHNTTEGLGIVSIIAERKTRLITLLGLGMIAGLPTVAGAWIGAFFFSPTLAAVFLAVATGAIAEVVVDVLAVVKQESSLGGWEALTGIASGLAVMYTTGLLVVA